MTRHCLAHVTQTHANENKTYLNEVTLQIVLKEEKKKKKKKKKKETKTCGVLLLRVKNQRCKFCME